MPKKPKKPRKDFPLTPHNTGRWCKKVRGRFVYYEKWTDDPDGSRSLARFLAERDDLYAGRDPRRPNGDTLADGLNAFLSSKALAVESGELTQRSYLDYQRACDRVAETIGKHRALATIDHHDLERLRASLAKGKRGKTVAPKTLFSDLIRVRSVFMYVNENLLTTPIKFKRPLASPSCRLLRAATLARGPKLFSREELDKILKAADPVMRAHVYLGLNAGFGAADCAALPVSALDLVGAWHNFPRPKTGVMRRAKLWPETIEAVREVMGDDLVFPPRRQPLSADFRRLLEGLDMHRPHVTVFYSLRRTLQTVAETCNQPVATSFIMGHVVNDMASIYRQKVYDPALIKVADHVRGWLLGEINIE
jgi:integrase